MSVHWIRDTKKGQNCTQKQNHSSIHRSQATKQNFNSTYFTNWASNTQPKLVFLAGLTKSVVPQLSGDHCYPGGEMLPHLEASHRNYLYPGGESELHLLDVPRLLACSGGLCVCIFRPKPCVCYEEDIVLNVL